LVEFALILPVLLLLLMGLFDFGRAIYAFNTISNAAREGARIAIIDQKVVTGPDFYLAEQEAANQATALGLVPSDNAQVRLQVLQPDGTACPGNWVGCVAQLRVQYQFNAITPIIGAFIGPIQLSTTTEIPIERTFSSP
jgi:Flp pilus assembly protein TadG